MGVASCRSVRNKAPMISDALFNHSLDILSLVETHIHKLILIVCFNPSHHRLKNCVKELVHMAWVVELAFS